MQESPLGVSVVICCYNSAARLPVTLSHLAAQRVNEGLPWEVLIVDNSSTDDTVKVAQACWQHKVAPLRVVSEPRLGQAYARRRGVGEARYEFVSFVDDDNWVMDEWVELAAASLQQRPDVAAVGSSSAAVFEVDPPSWFGHCQTLYAITSNGFPGGDVTSTPGSLWTAGLTLRKSAWQQIESENVPPLVEGRRGKTGSLAGGEDTELSYRLRLAGWKLWYEPRLRIEHYMPEGRLDWSYARRLYRGSGEAAAALLPYQAVLEPRSVRGFPALRQSWEWQLLQTIRSLLRRPGKLIRAAVARSEGDQTILETELLLGILASLSGNRGAYYRGLAQVKELAARLKSGQPVRQSMGVLV